MNARSIARRFAPTIWGLFALLPCAARAPAAEPPATPPVVRTVLTLAPTDAQLAGIAKFPAVWWITPAITRDLPRVLNAAGVPAELAERIAAAAEPHQGGSARIRPQRAWLDEMTPAALARWQAVLALHRDNDTHRWPLALTSATLDELALHPGLADVVAHIRRWGRRAGERIIFTELWALEDLYPDATHRRQFLRAALQTQTPFLKLATGPDSGGTEAGDWAAYWQVHGRYQAIQPFYHAVLRVTDHDRIDLAHILPRFPRSVIYTFPPEFAAGEDLGVECGLVAAEFFVRTPEAGARLLESGFSAWLAAECEPVTTALQFGDIAVFEDPARTRWPYAAVHIADGLLFARQPTLFGPWRFLTVEEIKGLNPRLGQSAVTWHRRRPPPSQATAFAPGGLPASWRRSVPLERGTPGPWGRLATYRVALAPPGDVLDSLPPPPPQPEWQLLLDDPAGLRRDLAAADMPAGSRRELLRLLERARPNRDRVVTLHPSPELVKSIPGLVRARLYRHLIPGTTPDAYAQTIRIASRVPAEAWFSAEDLPEPTRTDVISLMYPHGGGLAFSDYGALLALLPQERAARLGALRAVFRTPAQVVLLEKPAPGEVDKLVSYWGGSQQMDLATLLTSSARNPDVQYLDIVHLLPPLAREFLNLYAFTDARTPAASCYWTALNFDVEEPDSRLLVLANHYGTQSALAWERLQAEYSPIDEPGALGDIVAYVEKEGRRELVHVAAYVADNFVFTKNGLGLMAPWCLMRIEDVDALYLDGARIERRHFRRRR